MRGSLLNAVVRGLAGISAGPDGVTAGGASAGPNGACVGSFCIGSGSGSGSSGSSGSSGPSGSSNSSGSSGHSGSSGSPSISSTSPSVSLSNGTVNGGICSGNNAAAFFQGIPYAKAPTGDLRFAAPEAYDSKYSGGSLDATKGAPSCIQFASSGKESGQNSEDCLYLDVWAPVNASSSSGLPVRVFLYGGSNLVGGISDPLYDGCNVANDAVMVAMNYRVGPLGFLGLESAGIDGNQGIQDIMQGLEWVQSNIGAFGGDSMKVMLHGQSAGAIDAFTVATTDRAPQLMSALISESGGGRNAMQKSTAQNLGKNFAKALNCDASDAKCLRSKSTDDLTNAVTNQPELNIKTLGALAIDSPADGRYGTFVDGNIIVNQPAEQGVRVPAIFGTNSYEGTFFANQQFSDPTSATKKDYKQFLRENFGDQDKEVEQKYPLDSFNHTKYPVFYAISQVYTDAAFKCPASRALNTASSKNMNVWTYQFSTTPKCTWSSGMNQSDNAKLGATHSAEIPFMLNTTSSLPLPGGSCEMTSDEKNIASFMSKAWTEMARSQKPVQDDSQWPSYGGSSQSRGVTFANSTSAGTIDYSACDFWKHINDIQVNQGKNGTNVTSLELPRTHSTYWNTTTKTETGVYTVTTTTEKNGKTQDITETLTGTHAVVTSSASNATTTQTAETTTITQATTLAHTTVETTGGKTTTIVQQSKSTFVTTATVSAPNDDVTPTASMTYTAPPGQNSPSGAAVSSSTTSASGSSTPSGQNAVVTGGSAQVTASMNALAAALVMALAIAA